MLEKDSHVEGGVNMRRRKEPTIGWFGRKLGERDTNGRVIVSALQSPTDGGELRLEPFSEDTLMVPPSSRTGVKSPPASQETKNKNE